MPSYDFDFFVVGGGSGGVRASRMAAQYGARTALVELGKLGGTCVNVGCIPKKLLVYAAHYGHDMHDAEGFGWSVEGARHDWPTLIRNKDREIARLNGIYARLLKQAGVTELSGRGRFIDEHTVEVVADDGTVSRHTAKHVLIAVGGTPVSPDVPGKELAITSDDVFFLRDRPRRVVVVGGGYIGVELAGVFRGLGSRVDLVHRGDLFLRGFDLMLREGLAEEMREQGVSMHFSTEIDCIEKAGDELVVQLSTQEELRADVVLMATGRRPNTDGLGLENTGVSLDEHGAIRVDETSKCIGTSSLYAVGDVTNRVNLTPVALAEGMAVAKTLFLGERSTVDYRNIPSAVFSHPNLATVGLTELEARRTLPAVDIYHSVFTPLRHQLTGRKEKTRMKLVVERSTDRVVGCHMLGPEAGEIVQGLAVAILSGAKKADFDRTIGIHPTAAEEFVTMRTKAPDPEDE